MPQEQTKTEGETTPTLDTQDNAGRLSAVNDLLGIKTEETAKPERAAPDTEADQSVSEHLAEA